MLDAGLTKDGDKGAYDKFRSRIVFPLNDSAGRVVAFSGRIFAMPGKEVPEDTAKYMNSPETILFKKARVLYGFDRAKQSIRKHNFAILVEGQMDLVMVHQAGWGNAVAVSGTALTEEHVLLIRRMSDNLLLALDADEAGINAAKKSAMIALAAGMDVKVARLIGGKDPADIILHDGKDAWSKSVREAKHIIPFMLSVLSENTKDRRDFIKQAEKTVLPFLARIKSPMDRDHFTRVIADRLEVSPESVKEGLVRLPREEVGPATGAPASKSTAASAGISRSLEAWSILSVEEAKPSPAFDVVQAKTALAEVLGGSMQEIEEMAAQDKEAARFRAESQYEDARTTREAFEMLLSTLRRERLQERYREAQEALQKAERGDNEEEMKAALELCTALSGELAKLG